jgi:PilZ domain
MVAILKMPKPAYLESDEGGPERRIFPRKEIHARIQGRRTDHTIEAHREPFLNLALRDLSMGGLSAISQSKVDRGERVNVFFPPQGAQRGWDALGKVIRCEPSGFGFRIAVEFDPLPMAA